MPDWSQILNEINAREATFMSVSILDDVRRRYLNELHELTKRNIVVYYSGWLQNPLNGTEINDEDKTGFMTVLHELDHKQGLDLILHTPGGQTGATESLVDYLRAVYGTNIRAIVPHLAMSGGTVIACGCKEIYMGKHSSLGPIDPQIDGKPAHGVLADFNRAFEEIKVDPEKILVWNSILSQYEPALIDQCEKSIEMVRDMVTHWLHTGMFEHDDDLITLDDGNQIPKSVFIAHTLVNAEIFKSHARHIDPYECRNIGLKVNLLEDEPNLQDAVLSVHHACIHTLARARVLKLIENHTGKTFLQVAPTVPA